jgi:hypothetical protein
MESVLKVRYIFKSNKMKNKAVPYSRPTRRTTQSYHTVVPHVVPHSRTTCRTTRRTTRHTTQSYQTFGIVAKFNWKIVEREQVGSPSVFMGSVLVNFLVFRVMLFDCLRFILCIVPNVSSVSGFFILHWHFGFL